MKGWIVLDIDGTLTVEKDKIPDKVISYLSLLKKKGWNIFIITGRSYSSSYGMIEKINFPYFFSSHNGATAWHMPKKEKLFERFLMKDTIYKVVEEADKFEIITMVWGADEVCYVHNKQKKCLSSFIYHYSNCHSVDDFVLDYYPLIKCIGKKQELKKLFNKIKNLEVETSLVRDSFNKGYCLLLVTKKEVNKGSAISKILDLYGKSFVIAAGNDTNDLSMYNFANVKIAMKGSSYHLLKKADIIAPPAKNDGIILALKKAIKIFRKDNLLTICYPLLIPLCLAHYLQILFVR
ncbi:MAG: hypothetical protein AMS24_04145 [Chlamydiae bacterium SM23_39]|nr:MAG: hypothetical protein AMS24_04145 [Chlamydiae bacterium SM23_39]